MTEPSPDTNPAAAFPDLAVAHPQTESTFPKASRDALGVTSRDLGYMDCTVQS